MILKGSQRAGGKALAHHLMRTDENDHIDVHEIRGFVGNKLIDAFHEAYAISRGTKCKQFLFSLSLSPPSDKVVSVKAFERAIGTIEARLGLAGQPRAIVFHEKNGRRHAHCVWSRIDPRTMRARQMGHFKLKLVELSRELYLEHGWTLPGGLNREQKRRDNFSLAEGQQAKRIGRDPARLKQIFKDCWDSSDSSHSFQLALKQKGYRLARGDRRGYVAVDANGEIYSLSRWCGVPTKQLAERLAALSPLPSIAKILQGKEEAFLGATRSPPPPELPIAAQVRAAQMNLQESRNRLVQKQRIERDRLEQRLAERWALESVSRYRRLRTGLLGLWDWITGQRAKIMKRNEAEIAVARQRDASAREILIEAQLKERRLLQMQISATSHRRERIAEGEATTTIRGRKVAMTTEKWWSRPERNPSLDR